MFSWLLRLFLAIAGAIAEWFIVRDAPQFQLVQLCISFFLLVFIVFVLALWPRQWSRFLGRKT